MKSYQDKEKGKLAYEKPRLRTIELAAEEVLGLGCKTDSGDTAGLGGNGCVPAAGCNIDYGS